MVPWAAGPASGRHGWAGLRFCLPPPRGGAGPSGEPGTPSLLSCPPPAPCVTWGSPSSDSVTQPVFSLMRASHCASVCTGTVPWTVAPQRPLDQLWDPDKFLRSEACVSLRRFRVCLKGGFEHFKRCREQSSGTPEKRSERVAAITVRVGDAEAHGGGVTCLRGHGRWRSPRVNPFPGTEKNLSLIHISEPTRPKR